MVKNNLLQAQAPGVAPLDQIALVSVISGVLSLAVIYMLWRYRNGKSGVLSFAGGLAERLTGLPAWSIVPVAVAITGGAVALLGVTWDVALHIDNGRDEGPLGTAGHYPILIGLLLMYTGGMLAVGMPPSDARKSSPAAIKIGNLWPLPASSLFMAIAAFWAYLGFPLDDVWHRLFGQDVTIWGPTHIILIVAAVLSICFSLLLLVEGSLVAGRSVMVRSGLPLLNRPIPVLLGGVVLIATTVLMGEFNWGTEQFRLVWQPMLIAFSGALGLVLARSWGGPGAAFGAFTSYIVPMAAFSLLVGGPLNLSMPSMPLYLVEMLLVEAAFFSADRRGLGASVNLVRRGAIAGLLIGTVGFAGEYLWAQVAMPFEWSTHIIPEALLVAIVAGIAGGTLGGLFARSIMGWLVQATPTAQLASAPPAQYRIRLTALVAGLTFIALAINALWISNPEGVSVKIDLSDVAQATVGNGTSSKTAIVTATFSDPKIAENADWVQAMAWQGGGRVIGKMRQLPNGSFRSENAVPIDGNWKSLVRVHKGHMMLAAPVYFPKDEALKIDGTPAVSGATQTLVYDQKLLQIEAQNDMPRWSWYAAALFVLSTVIALFIAFAFVTGRIGKQLGKHYSEQNVSDTNSPVDPFSAAGEVRPGLLQEFLGVDSPVSNWRQQRKSRATV